MVFRVLPSCHRCTVNAPRPWNKRSSPHNPARGETIQTPGELQ
jgi:hypothetical protein